MATTPAPTAPPAPRVPLAPERATRRKQVIAIGVLVAAVVVLWLVRPWFHGLAMLLYQYPLLTWIPVLLGVAVRFAVKGARAQLKMPARPRMARRLGIATGVVSWIFFMIMLPGWQGRALYEATTYQEGGPLPFTTQPRLLPKDAAKEFGHRDSLHNAHLAVDPTSGQLVWTAEKAKGLFHRGPGEGIAIQPLDRVDGTFQERPAQFHPAVSRLGPGSIKWRAYKRHYFTRVQDRVIVPLAGGGAIAVAPYIGYKGFPVRHPYLKGVYVYHQDGTLEDLTPEQARARPELVASGRIFPEDLARRLAQAYGYRTGSGAAISDRPRSIVDDPTGNPQPYLTNLGDGRIKWVTVGHADDHDDQISTLFLTDAVTGQTQVWHAPPGRTLLSNQGAAHLARGLDLEWDRTVCCDSDGHSYTVWIRHATEPRPVFASGRFYYLVSIVTNRDYETTREPVDKTVLVDAEERNIIKVFDHDDPDADHQLRAFFEKHSRRHSP